ncbi:MAG: lamin tail domain-containing protein [Pirellulales bacterium]|nr:lamin tail domain-containing protein [Pirellulales bacterium]
MLRNFKGITSAYRHRRLRREPATAGSSLARRQHDRLVFEPLEPRMLLDGSLVISEFMALNDSGRVDGDGEHVDWIEVHNPTASPIELGGWYLTDKADNLTKWQFPTHSLAAGDYLLVFASEKAPNGPPGELHTNFKLSGDGEYLGLVRPNGTTIEFEYAPAFPQQYPDVSYGLSPNLATRGYFTAPTPGEPNLGQPVPDPTHQLVITEIMYHPSSQNDLEEYIELHNEGSGPVDLSGWQITDGVDFAFPNVSIPKDGYLVVAADVAAFSAKYPGVTNVIGGWSGHLANGGETVEVVDSIGVRVDRVSYADEGDWASRELGPLDYTHRGWQWTDDHDGGGKSLELINLLVPNEYGQNWKASTADQGTPGAANSAATTDIAPLVVDVAHGPVIPRATDPVVVTARIIDELDTGLTVSLHYRVDTSTYDQNTYPTYNAASYTVVAMRDDGASGDGAAGDGVYGGQVPSQPDGTVVEFFVEASDAGAHSRTWPAPSNVDGTPQQVTNALYQVDDSFDPEAQWTPGSKPIYRILMTEAERLRLADIGDGGTGSEDDSNAQMNATFISVDGVDVELRYNAGVRNRGHGTRTGPPNNYRVNFANDRPWQSMTRININCQNTDSQILGMAMYQMAGLPAPNAVGVQVLVNGTDLSVNYGRMYGTYVSLEAPDTDFTARHFPQDGDGNLYKGLRLDDYSQEADFRYEGANPDAYRDTYFKMTNEDVDDWSDLIHMTDVLANAPEESYLAEVSTVIDVDQWLHWLALDALLLNRETGLSRGIGDDYTMYAGFNDPRFVLIPHDLDSLMQLSGSGATDQSIFAPADGVSGSNGVEALDRLLHHPDVTPLYYQAFLDLMGAFFNRTVLDPLIDRVLGPFAPASTIVGIKNYIDERTAEVLSQIPREFTIDSSLPVVGGYHLTGSPVAAITGTADASETYLVRVNGVDVDWSPREGTWAFGQGGIGATVLSFQDGVNPDATYAGTVDTEIRWSTPTADLSTETSINVDGSDDGGAVQALIRFDNIFGDGPGQVALTDPIARATLTLNVTDTGDNMQLHRMLSGWAETSNWNTFGGNGVQANGIEAMATADAVASAGSTGRITIDVTSSVLAWQAAPSSNHGWVLLPTGSGGVDFDSHEDGTGANRPMLSVTLDDGTPGTGGVPLNPGVNRIVVETFDNREGTGEPLETGYIDVWYDADQTENVIPAGNVSGEWSPVNGYYHVTGSITVPAGQTLTIQPGTAVYFDPGTRLTVNGRFLAEGLDDHRITLTRFGESGAWAGIVFSYGSYSTQVNHIAYADISYSDSAGDAVEMTNAQVVLENVNFNNHEESYYLDIHTSSIIVRNSTFPDLGSGELIHGTGFPTGGYALFEGNWFGRANGYNDVIDFTGGQRPGPILRVMNNYFSGGGDDALDLDSTDAHIEGNVFVDFHQDGSRDSKSHAIATGNDLDQSTEVTIVRNLFYDVDHAIIIKDGAHGTIVNNTIVNVYKKYTTTNATTAAINFFEDRPPQYEGNGVYLDGNIFYNVSALFEHLEPTTRPVAVTMNNSIVYPATDAEPVSWVGTGNLIGVDPLLSNPNPSDITEAGIRAAFALLPGSPAVGTGPNGVDMGGLIPAGATIAGEPPANTTETSATLTVGGPHIYGYKYRVNEGVWSTERAAVKTVGSITRVGSTATVTLTAHGYANGDVVDIYGSKQREYNGAFTVANATVNTFQVTVTGAPTSPATGTIIARRREPIVLSGLAAGDYTVEVIARDSAGIWQAEAEASVSKTWTVEAPGGAPASIPTNQAGQEALTDAPQDGPILAAAEIPAGNISVDTILTAADGPYTFTGSVVVDSGVTLTIEPGTTLFFEDNTSLTINGRLLAEGTKYQQIRFTHVPNGGSWNGLQFADTMQDNRLSYAVLEYATTNDGLVGVVNSNLLIDHCTFDHAQRRRIRTLDSTLIVRNSTFTDIFGPGEAPITDNLSEHIWGRASDSGQFLIENNVFGTTKGHNDVIDVDGHSSPATVMQYLNNVFLGGGDDALDLEGDALIEGNTFMHIRKDQWNTGTGDSNVISAGAGHDFTMARNTFYDVDHIAQVKDDAFLTLVNNTLVGGVISAVYFVRPGDTSGPGRGAYVEGNIFAETAVIFNEVQVDTDLVAHRNIMPAAYHVYGTGNLDEDPRLADPTVGDFHLLPGSPAVAAGPNGQDMGAMVPGGPSIAGEPPATTAQTAATLTVGGPGIAAYRYRVNGGVWSSETPVASPIVLTGLADGDYTVEVQGKNRANVWQDEADASVSQTWAVDTSPLPLRVRINEVLAINTAAVEHEGTYPDLIELYNAGPNAVDLAGMSLSDNSPNPAKYVFPSSRPAETTIPAGGYLVVYADNDTGTSGLHLGFALDGDGEAVLLYDTAANGGALLDSVEFGMQLADLSIGRIGHRAEWALCQPTLGTANVAQRTGNPATLKINEWFANGDVRLADDFLELYNADPLPVPLAGLYLSDRPYGQPDMHEIAPLSFVAGSGYAVFVADSDTAAGANHVGFKLSSGQELLGLFDAQLKQIDKIVYYPQTTDVAEGRAPDGAESYAFSRLPTPGVSNPFPATITVPLIAMDSVWSYDQSGAAADPNWNQPEFTPVPAWPSGPGVLGVEDSTLPSPINTPLSLGSPQVMTYYFRTHFTLDADPASVVLTMSTLIDDGAIFYLNGQQVYQLGMGPPVRSVGDADPEGPFTLPTGSLRQGDNVLAVEVHQTSDTSSDVVFGMTLDATITVSEDARVAQAMALLDGLRVTEIMYHPAENTDTEFVELQNVGAATLDLTGARLAGGIDFTFPALMLAPGDYVVVVSNREAFARAYGPGNNVAGEFSGSLCNCGEELVLQLAAPLEAAVLRFEYSDAWYPTTDGDGYALQIRDPAAKAASWSQSQSWQTGTVLGGTPGSAEGTPRRDVVINEVLTHTDPPLVDSIELYNTTADPIDVGGWYLSDSDAAYLKFRIPDGTTIPAFGYVVFDEDDFNPTPLNPGPNDFALDGAHGDEVYLVAAGADGKPTRFVDYAIFGAAKNGESFGRWPNGEGPLYPMSQRTLDPAHGQNSGPRVGPVIISEVQYNPGTFPDAEEFEFVEIYNPTAAPVGLAHWRLGKGVDFDFPADAVLDAYGVAVVVPFDPADTDAAVAFRTHYGIDASVRLWGPFSGHLDDGGERVQLQRPDTPPPDEPGFYPRLLEDEVVYDDEGSWPVEADGTGSSLYRLQPESWGNDGTMWTSGPPTPGSVEYAAPGRVVARHVFYNFSSFDGNNAAANALDDGAIAPDKTALLPGQTATFANYTSYTRGINGVMIDIAGVPGDTVLDAGDFQFRVGNSNTPSTWAITPAPSSVTLRLGAGQGGSDRVTIIWPDYAISKQWLQVTVLANADTGLLSDDVFYFGNAVGEAGNSTLDAKVNATDMLLARNNPRNFLNPAPIDFHADFNRDARVNATDMLIARNNQTNFLNALRLITVPGVKAAESAALDAVWKKTAVEEAATPQSSPAKMTWLYEFEKLQAKQNPAKNVQAADQAIDALLADPR